VEKKGMGLRIMQHRAHSIGGVLTVSSHPCQGASIECSVPLALCRIDEPPKGTGTKSN
jgi:signal transduction histidine kinase